MSTYYKLALTFLAKNFLYYLDLLVQIIYFLMTNIFIKFLIFFYSSHLEYEMFSQITYQFVTLYFKADNNKQYLIALRFQQKYFTFSIMINNNPYNLPQRPTNKQNRIYTQVTPVPFRPQISQGFAPYNQYKARQTVNMNQMSNKNSISVEQANSPFRPSYPGVRNDMLHFVPSPKNNNTTGNTIPNNFNPSNSKNRGSGNIAASCDKKQIGSLRESFGVSMFDIKQINQKIELINLNVRATEKRLGELQKNNSNVFLPNNSKVISDGQSTLNFNSQTTQLISKYQMEWVENLNRVKQEIVNIKEELRNNKTPNKFGMDFQRIVIEKCKQVIESTKGLQNNSSSVRNGQNGQEQVKKQIDGLRMSLEEKIKKNFQFLTSVIGRIQRELHTSLLTIQPNFKQSALKCSTTAILLRFVQCFKVRKHSAKNGQIKITLTDNTYYIDGQGYLLDKEQFYIVDSREFRVRLEDKHIRLLKEENILL